jgi:hypothetical protein
VDSSPCTQKVLSAIYRPRRPRSSPLYSILQEHFERFLLVYEDKFEKLYGPLRSVVKSAVYRFLECGILEYGFARVVCGNCRAEFLAAFSCKTRMLCPSCEAKRLVLWSQWLGEHLLAKVPHRMITLTVPKRLRPFFLRDRRLLGLLARCAAETIKIYYGEMTGEPRGVPGIVVSIQTFGNRAGNPNPHLHCLGTDGVFLPDGSFASASFLPPVDITELFRRTVLREFVKRELMSEEVAENMLSWPHSGFHVHLGPLIHEDEGELLKTTARYSARAPLSLSRLSYDRDTRTVTYAYTNPYDGTDATEILTPLELIARLVAHIPNQREQIVRYGGAYSHRTRGAWRKRGITTGETRAGAPAQSWKKSWAELLQLVFEVSLTCPRCGGEMKIISVITGAEPIQKILGHLRDKGIDPRAGPFAHSAA